MNVAVLLACHFEHISISNGYIGSHLYCKASFSFSHRSKAVLKETSYRQQNVISGQLKGRAQHCDSNSIQPSAVKVEGAAKMERQVSCVYSEVMAGRKLSRGQSLLPSRTLRKVELRGEAGTSVL